MPTRIRKDVALAARECRTLAWLMAKRARRETLGPGEDLRREEGIEIGRRARGLWPDGVLVDERDPDRGEARSKAHMADRAVPAIFEATFVDEGAVAKVDVLERVRGGWRVIEVKSTLTHEEHLDDITYTASVLRGNGVRLVSHVLLVLNRAYRLGDPDWKLFRSEDVTQLVRGRLRAIRALRTSVHAVVTRPTPPTPRMVPACRTCPYFATDCIGRGVEHPLFELPRLGEKALATLWDAGRREVRDVREDEALTADQRRVRDAIRDGRRLVNRDRLREHLSRVAYPAAYLDFEAVKTALPLWEGVGPHEQVVTQFSIQWRAKEGGGVSERAFLARHDRDDRREVAERLIAALRGAASVIVYSTFEKTTMKSLAKRFPDLASDLHGIVDGLYDLLGAVQPQLICDPRARGRTSIKWVLPALVPDMGYDGLAIADGEHALAAFARLAQGGLTADQVELTRASLLRYCAHDTMAMVRLHDALVQSLSARAT